MYDVLLTDRLLADLDSGRADLTDFSSDRQELLIDALTRQLSNALADSDEAGAASRHVEIINSLLALLRQRLQSSQPGATSTVDLIAMPPQVLQSIRRDPQFPDAPELGLAAPWLFTAGKGSPSLLQEIRKELASADQVDILVSFITVSGVRKLQDVLQQITARGGDGGATTRLRILTTTYTGATEARALDELACGPVVLETAEGDRPMTITWQLDRPLSAALFREFSVLRGV
ncbi:MAG: hypothetical protein QM766_25005 [Burkholderiaceae bacterium]